MTNPDFSGENELEVLKADIETFQKELESKTLTTKKYNDTVYNLNMATQRSKLINAKLNAYNHSDWKEFYKSNSDLTLIDLNIAKNDEYQDNLLINTLSSDYKYYNYMAEHNLSFDDRWGPIQGMSFTAHIMSNYLPVILAILIIFIVSILYCFNYVDKMNIHNLIPLSKIKSQSTKLLVGVTCGILILTFFIILTLSCGTIGDSFGSLQSGILTYTLQDIDDYVPFLSILPQLIVLTILSIFFLVNFVSVISLITKKRMLCLIISLAIILGFMWVTTNIIPLASIIHLLPTTYINSLKVISGEMMYTVVNGNVTFILGVVVLVISNIILFGIYSIGSNSSIKKVMQYD